MYKNTCTFFVQIYSKQSTYTRAGAMDLRSRGEASQKSLSIMDNFTVTIVENRRKKNNPVHVEFILNTQKQRRLDSNKDVDLYLASNII